DGVCAAPGLASGPVVRLDSGVGAIVEAGTGEAHERRALHEALHAVAADIEAAALDAARRGQGEQAEIFAAHLELVGDPELRTQALARIAERKSAAHAWHQVVQARCAALVATHNPLIAERAADLRDIERRVLVRLCGEPVAAAALPAGAVVLAEDLLPSQFAALADAGVAAIATALGGPTSHVAILARARGIPMLVALGPALAGVAAGATVLVDADQGWLDTTPSEAELAAARERIGQGQARREADQAQARTAAVTLDGRRVEVAANVADAAEVRAAVEFGAEGVGLLRTELMFMERASAPSEDEQRRAYQAVVDALQGRPLIIRTLDVGADKTLPYLPLPAEENPALGLRGIRLGLAHEALLAEQLRAILALRPLAAVKIMLPMVTDLGELRAVRGLLERLAREAGVKGRVELGVMIETPAAALLADQLALEADFFSVGSNDLTQYALCMDRVNPALAPRLDGLHPAVLRLIAQAARAAAERGRWIGVCGALASEPAAVPLLIGLGVNELSASPAALAHIKALVRRLDAAACRGAANAALLAQSAAEVRTLVAAAWPWLASF
ncbi:MAG: phosphoenolpyruvate--protein phosphotransferase, partial [Burkholderiales bacterium]|nr:phosphoenolpyruvate--protein phosphotransferase [Burkholderiales bacterium]